MAISAVGGRVGVDARPTPQAAIGTIGDMSARGSDPHNLRSAVAKAGVAAIIDIDRECVGCGYNLRGLRYGMPCPECGLISTLAAGGAGGEIDDALSLAPPRVILAFIRGCWAASIIITLVVGLIMAQRFPDWNAKVSRWGLFGLALLWLCAVMWLTPAFAIPQAASRGFWRRSRLRKATRWMQLGWPLAAGMTLLQHEITLTTQTAALTQAVFTVSALVGLTGTILLSIMLERLSEWARDDRAQNLFNWAMWTIPITTLLLVVDIPLPMVGLIFGILWLIGIALFPYALLSLSSAVTLCIVHSYEHRQREERRADRDRRHEEKIARTVQTMDAERARRGHV